MAVSSLGSRVLAAAAAGGLRSHDSYPLITGCLAECGHEEQTCVTTCQVCVEEHKCKSVLKDCDRCLEGARRAKAAAQVPEGSDTTLQDSGGTALLRDGLSRRLLRAKLEALGRRRGFRVTRAGVLKAQREAEWAVETREAAANDLRRAKTTLRETEADVAKWKVDNARKLRKERARAMEARQDRLRADRHLETVTEELNKAKARLKWSRNATSRNTTGRTEQEAKEEQLRAGQEVARLEEEVRRAEEKADELAAQSNWIDKGLQEKVDAAKAAVHDANEELKTAHAMEQITRKRLEEAKMHYVKAAVKVQDADEVVSKIDSELEDHPMQIHLLSAEGIAPGSGSRRSTTAVALPLLLVAAVRSLP